MSRVTLMALFVVTACARQVVLPPTRPDVISAYEMPADERLAEEARNFAVTAPQMLKATSALPIDESAMAADSRIKMASGCSDPFGNPVLTISNPMMNDVAATDVVNGRPVIVINPQRFAMEHPVFTRFMYVHECAHHVLGHVVRAFQGVPVGRREEAEADCFAIVQLLRAGEFQAPHVQLVQGRFFPNPGDATHAAGPERARLLGDCAVRAVG